MIPVKGRFRPGLTVTLVLLHLIAAYGVWWCATWGVSAMAIWLAVGLFVVTMMCVTVGYHRYFTHGDFHCSTWFKYGVAIGAAPAGQGDVDEWQKKHRQHHYDTEGPYDPHTPTQWRHFPFPFNNRVGGFLWSHIVWLIFETVPPPGYEPGIPVHDRKVVEWQKRYYWYLVLAGFIVPFVLAGWAGLFLAGFIRFVFALHCAWLVNSVGHTWGSRAIGRDGKVRDKDQSRNNLLVALLTMGEGYHANHHQCQRSAALGYKWYHWDPGKWFIYGFGLVGVTRDIRPFVKP